MNAAPLQLGALNQCEPLGTTFDKLYRQLSARMTGAAPVKPLGQDRVRVENVKVAPALFEARSSGREHDHGGQTGHAWLLERALRAKPSDAQEFDPITVFEIAGDDFCVDGHHRLAVYRAVLGGDATIPVVRIGGTLGDAIAASVQANTKLFLQMNHAERQEAAWKLVKIGHGSKREQAEMSGMGETFIAKLRRLKRKLEESHSGQDWGSLWEAESLAKAVDDDDAEEWTEEKEAEKVAEYVRRLRRALGENIRLHPERVMAALMSILSPVAVVDAVRQTIPADVCLSDYGFLHEDDEEEDEEDYPF
ncbi:MAG: hypothetical protein RLO21_03840 [Nitratireductor sp.]|uniref:hypothetical protein n=1 Tax=Nitratireductor rhodophyticola TaxID=2854036 RepID=UPI003008696A